MKDARSQERYEDALFALLMQQMWEEQEQDQPQEIAEQRPADELDRRCLSMIRKHYGRVKARKAGKTLWKVVRRAAMAACLAIALFAVAYATSETVRINTKNLLITIFPTNTELSFPGEMEGAPSLSVGWVPEQYTLTGKKLEPSRVRLKYEDTEGNALTVTCRITDGMTIGFDTENAVVEDVTVQGNKGLLIEKNGEYQLAWPAKDNTRLLNIVAYGLSREELFQFAEALVYD